MWTCLELHGYHLILLHLIEPRLIFDGNGYTIFNLHAVGAGYLSFAGCSKWSHQKCKAL